LKDLNPRQESRLDSGARDLDFVASGLDFVAPDLVFVASGLVFVGSGLVVVAWDPDSWAINREAF
jgi:hypothetical protein